MGRLNRYGFFVFMIAFSVGIEAYGGKKKIPDPAAISKNCPFCVTKFNYADDSDSTHRLNANFRKHMKGHHRITNFTPEHSAEYLSCPLKHCEYKIFSFREFAKHLNSHERDSKILFESHTNTCPICIVNGVSAHAHSLNSSNKQPLSEDQIRRDPFPNWVNHSIECPRGDKTVTGLKGLFIHALESHPLEKNQVIQDHLRGCEICKENRVKPIWFGIEKTDQELKAVQDEIEEKYTQLGEVLKVFDQLMVGLTPQNDKGCGSIRNGSRSSDLAFSDEQLKEAELIRSLPQPQAGLIRIQGTFILSQTIPKPVLDLNFPSFELKFPNFEDVKWAYSESAGDQSLGEEEKAKRKKQGN